MKSAVILISGRGSNMQALVEAKPGLDFRAVISNRPDGEEPDQPSAAEFRQAAEAVGLGRAELRRAADCANEREVFDRPIGKNQGIQHP